MASIFKLFGSDKTNQPAKGKEIEKFRSFGGNIEVVPPSNTTPEHLLVHGTIMHNGKSAFEVRTAVVQRGTDIEFSTNVGQVPNNPLGGAIKEHLSHRVDGKFVSFPNQQEPNTMDLVYTTRKPDEWLNQQRFNQETKNHAIVSDVLKPVLDASLKLPQPKRTLNYPELIDTAKDIVDSHLDLQDRLSGRLSSSKYVPKIIIKK